jgi:hypothetical protein
MSKLSTKIGTLLVVLFSLFTFTANAQKYGGSAYVTVKSKDGNYRVINVVSDNALFRPQTSTSDAKNALLSKLKQELAYEEEMADDIYYDVDVLTTDNYKGQASVRVKDKDGSRRVISVTTGDYDSDKTLLGRMRELLEKLKTAKKYNEEFIEGINYDLN